MTAANVAPFFIGRPDFDGAIINKQMSFGWLVSTYRATETCHLEHPDRPQYAKMKKHPDSLDNRRLMMSLRGIELVNEASDIRISRTEITKRRNGTWYFWPLNQPKGLAILTNANVSVPRAFSLLNEVRATTDRSVFPSGGGKRG
jgi:hypothetical protein